MNLSPFLKERPAGKALFSGPLRLQIRDLLNSYPNFLLHTGAKSRVTHNWKLSKKCWNLPHCANCTKLLSLKQDALIFQAWKKCQVPTRIFTSHDVTKSWSAPNTLFTTPCVTMQYYLLEEVRSKYSPSFFHLTTGCGYPLGGAHLRIVSSPTETSVSFGRILNSSLMSAI